VVAAVTAAGGTISLLVGAVLLRLTVTGDYRRYVRVGMGPWLAVAGVAVIVLGLFALVRALRRDVPADAHDHPERGGRAGWLLLAPIAALLLVAPPTLGSYGVGRGAAVDIRSGPSVFDPVPRGGGPVGMTLLEFGQRAFDRGGASLAGAAVQLTGFVASSSGEQFLLARYQIACCAADAAPTVVRVTGVLGDLPPRDQWVSVTGTLQPGAENIPELAATSVVEIPAPGDPYE
jgi:uncharacterized repeat protein (TIGR03943 family)